MNAIIIRKYSKDVSHKKRPFNFAFDNLAWVALAASKDPYRPFLCGIYHDGEGNFVGTDGHRLHVAVIDEYKALVPKGTWAIVHRDLVKIILERVTDKNGEDVEYPNWHRPMKENWTDAETMTGEIQCGKKSRDGMLWQFFSIAGKCCAVRYVQDATSGSDTITVRTRKDMQDFSVAPVFLRNNNRTACIMPVKI